jgi:hypothetical protein
VRLPPFVLGLIPTAPLGPNIMFPAASQNPTDALRFDVLSPQVQCSQT